MISLAKEIAQWSKDPSTKTGAVITDEANRIISTGFNGFPQYIEDKKEWLNDRKEKLARVIHCEMNAILFAQRDLSQATLYTWPFISCDRCAVHVIQAGIVRVCAPSHIDDGQKKMYFLDHPRWKENFKRSISLFKDANVIIELY